MDSQHTLTAQLQARIAELESKLAFQDDTIDQLNHAVGQQQLLLSKLERQVALLGQLVKSVQPANVIDQALETPPPHY